MTQKAKIWVDIRVNKYLPSYRQVHVKQKKDILIICDYI